MSAAADCEIPQPCDDYVDYMCTCHADDADFDCEELQSVFADADPALQDQCSIDLADQQDQDDADGLDCAF
jgi:hypothetical protein